MAATVSCASQSWHRVELEAPAMGTRFRVVLYAHDRAAGEAAAQAALLRVEELDAKLSDYRDDSALSRLSALSADSAPTPFVEADRDLFGVLACAEGISFISAGAFDVTVGPAVQLWRRARRQNELPSSAQLDEALHAMGWNKLELDQERQRVRLLARDMRLDVGGIGKGFAVDRALETLAAHGIERALVAGGGDVGVRRAPPDERAWRIAIAPFGESHDADVIELENQAVSTSGDVYQAFEIDGQRYSHVIDPRSAWALANRRAATVVAEDATRSDALATALCVLDPTEGLALAQRVRGVEARIVSQLVEGAEVVATPGFARLILAAPTTSNHALELSSP